MSTTNDAPAGSAPRWKQTTAIGLLIVALYGAFLLALQQASGVDYDLVADSASNLLRFIVLPVLAGAIVLSVVWWRSGWGRSVFHDDPSLRVGGVFWFPVVIVVAQIVFGFTEVSWGDLAATFLLYGLIGTLLVGFTEELLTRGLLLDAVRKSSSEVQAFLVSSITFGLLHGMNIINGQGAGLTLQQVFFTMISGVTFYAARRATGSLLLSMVLHGLFDFQILMQGEIHLNPENAVSGGAVFSGVLVYLEVIAAIIITVKVVRSRNRTASSGDAADVTYPYVAPDVHDAPDH